MIIIDKNGLVDNYNKLNSNSNNININKNKVIFFGIDPQLEKEINISIKNNLPLNINKNQNKKLFENVLISNKIFYPQISKKTPLFYIKYDPHQGKYFLKSLSKEIFFSLRIDREQGFCFEEENESDNFIKIGKALLNISVNNKESSLKIEMKSTKELPFDEQVFYFNKEDMPLTIGRSLCSINIQHVSISKVHAFIEFDEIIKKFIILDYDSTNGTHLVLNENKTINLNEKMNFCIGNKYFCIQEIIEENIDFDFNSNFINNNNSLIKNNNIDIKINDDNNNNYNK